VQVAADADAQVFSPQPEMPSPSPSESPGKQPLPSEPACAESPVEETPPLSAARYEPGVPPPGLFSPDAHVGVLQNGIAASLTPQAGPSEERPRVRARRDVKQADENACSNVQPGVRAAGKLAQQVRCSLGDARPAVATAEVEPQPAGEDRNKWPVQPAALQSLLRQQPAWLRAIAGCFLCLEIRD